MFELETIRHSASHIMAAALQELYPDIKFDIGPATDNGFYYDFDLDKAVSNDDFQKIENLMKKIINQKIPFDRFELERDEAEKILKEQNQTYKIERLADIPQNEKISFYKCGDFVDLCRGPHVDHSGQIKAFKLLSVAGSYYRGIESNPMLQRIYGTAFVNKKALRNYMKQMEEAKKRDHRKLGTELELFSSNENIGPGLILWHPKGAFIRNEIESFWREEHYKNAYELIYTPHIGRTNLWKTSGHLDFYNDAMYSPMDIDGNDYYVKPMNCPFHIEIYRSRLRSYRELPLKWAELGTVYRYEKSGVLHGLLRVRGFTQDDAHIICTPKQVENEIAEVLKFSMFMWKSFGFEDIKAYISTRPAKSVGEESRWDQALQSLQKAVEICEMDCEFDHGGGAFYGPKIDLKIKDAIGREWQTSTIQFDFNLPERFDMTYVDDDGAKKRPYMIHRALFGSLERFFGILVEHYSGAFPLWLAPEQIRLLPIAERHLEKCEEIKKIFTENGIRAKIDYASGTVGSKIKRARHERIPYLGIIGDKELENNTVSARNRREGQLGSLIIEDLQKKILTELEKKI